jgi:hypothetical protein
MKDVERRLRAVVTVVFAGCVVAACGAAGPAGEWTGVERDSAGVAMIENPAEGTWAAGGGWEVEEELRIGALDGAVEYQFGNIMAIEVGPEGEIYVLDQQAQEIRSFDAEGTFLRRLGRPGSGPGELTPATTTVILSRGDTLLVPDMGAQRVNRYLTDGSEAGSFPIRMEDGIPMKWVQTPDHDLVQQAMTVPAPGQQTAEMSNQLLLRGSDGAVRDTILALPLGESFRMDDSGPQFRLFGIETVWGLTLDGRLASGTTDTYRIEIRRLTGDLERVITKRSELRPVSESDRRVYLNALEEVWESQDVPPPTREMVRNNLSFGEWYPAFMNMLGGPDGTLWVQHVQTPDHVREAGGVFDLMQDVGAPDWDIFDADGRYLGVLRLPSRYNLMRVEGEQLYGVWRDDLDVQHVMRLRLIGAE